MMATAPVLARNNPLNVIVRSVFPEISTSDPKIPGQRAAIFGIRFLALYIFGKMFYIFTTGNAQPADVLLAVIALFITSPYMFMIFTRENGLSLLFLFWIFIVQLTWSAITAKINMSFFIFYYIFNIAILICVYSLRQILPNIFDRYVIITIKLSLLFQMAATLANLQGRALGTFNNPNQLAYWGILSLSLLIILKRNRLAVADYVFALMGMFCVLASLSRAGVIGIAMLVVIFAWFTLKSIFRRLLGGVVIAAIAVTMTMTGFTERLVDDSDVGSRFAHRVEQRQTSDPLAGRNYDRITNYPQYLLFGAGEGNYGRFTESWRAEQAIEIHSTFATLLFCYGVIGLMLFLGFIISVMWRSSIELGMYLVPALVYGITHQGLRFSYFWIVVGTLCSIAAQREASSIKRTVVRVPPRVGVRVDRSPERLRQMADRQD